MKLRLMSMGRLAHAQKPAELNYLGLSSLLIPGLFSTEACLGLASLTRLAATGIQNASNQ